MGDHAVRFLPLLALNGGRAWIPDICAGRKFRDGGWGVSSRGQRALVGLWVELSFQEVEDAGEVLFAHCQVAVGEEAVGGVW